MKNKILKYALQNAIHYEGKANQGAVIGKLIQEDPSVKSKLKELAPEISKVIKDIQKLTVEEQTEKLKELAPELLEKKKKEEKKIPDLPNAKEGKVVMRVAPYPSGPLHIGNAKPFIMNDELVKKYKGKLILVMDDTIGSVEKTTDKEAYKLIPEGLDWLGIKYDKKILFKSDRLEIYYDYAKQLIEKDKAYVCTCDSEKMREYRRKAMICDCRKHSIDVNLEGWGKMFNEYKEGEAALRIKTDMDHPNPAFRDRVLFRISEREHPRVENKYRVWPLLEMSWAIDDHLLGMTHILRGKDLMMESEMEYFIWDIFGWKHPEIIYSGLLQIEGIKLSKSKAQKEVESGEYIGWDDPRSWSLQSLKRRGIRPEAIRKFIISFGLNRNEIKVPIETLFTENRKILDEEVNRYFFVENPQKISIKEAPEIVAELPLHPDNKKRGMRKLKTNGKFYVSEDIKKSKTYRFMHLYNFKNEKFLGKEMDVKLKAKLIHWLPQDGVLDAEVFMPDGKTKKGVIEKTASKIKVDEMIQLERFGFVRLDKKEKNKLYFWYAHD
jgi:glutamyl-tRNA synthetase